jgi:hypothetical protein
VSRIVLTGVGKAVEAMKRIYAKDAATADSALKQAANMILSKSHTYVPVEFGALRKSGRVTKESTSKTQFRYRVDYGGPTAPYALIVHENPDAYHAPPTCYKYLERASRELKGTIAALIKRRLQAAVSTPSLTVRATGTTK